MKKTLLLSFVTVAFAATASAQSLKAEPTGTQKNPSVAAGQPTGSVRSERQAKYESRQWSDRDRKAIEYASTLPKEKRAAMLAEYEQVLRDKANDPTFNGEGYQRRIDILKAVEAK